MKVLTVIGTRPEAIKMAPVLKALQNNKRLHSQLCVTAQHRGMLDQVLELFQLKPDYDLNVMEHNQDIISTFSRIVHDVGKVLADAQPSIVLVHGDTATTLASSIAAYFNQVPVAHVEAGLRTGNIYSPWPEEINRKMTACVSKWHFAPTERARQNLLNEGVDNLAIHVIGNTVIDALLEVNDMIDNSQSLQDRLNASFRYLDPAKKLMLVTGHRRESFGEGFQNICSALNILSRREDLEILYPVHLNPSVNTIVRAELSGKNNVHLIEPVDYLEITYLMKRASLLLTDSGGIQEEAPALGKPVLVMRDTTERPEALDAGTARLCGTRTDNIVNEVNEVLDNAALYQSMACATNPYGDGNSSQRIVAVLESAII